MRATPFFALQSPLRNRGFCLTEALQIREPFRICELENRISRAS